jgi:hypothetical protein
MRRKRLSRFVKRLKQESSYPLAKLFYAQMLNRINTLQKSGKISGRVAAKARKDAAGSFMKLTGVPVSKAFHKEHNLCVCEGE